MKTVLSYCTLAVLLASLNGCIVSGPKYTRTEKVMELKLGMSLDEVNQHLGIKPYYIKSYDSIGERSFVYKYRVTDRKTVPFLVKETNGIESIGKYMDLVTYYTKSDTLYKLESKLTETEIKEKKLNINTLITAITVTVPSILVYLGITNSK
jgi:hypothetical protein